MGLFRDLGRRVQRFKEQAEEASQREAERGCRACGELVYTDEGPCPNCGSEDVVRIDGDAGDSADDSASDGAGDEPDADGEPGDDGPDRS